MKYEILEKIAQDYHKKCDDFDNKICSWKDKYWDSIPIWIYENQLVNANARIVLQNAYNIWIMNDISRYEILKAIQNFNTETWKLLIIN